MTSTFKLTFTLVSIVILITSTSLSSIRPSSAQDSGYVGNNVRISAELSDAKGMKHAPTQICNLSPEEKAVLTWLRAHENEIIEAEAKWNIDRRAIAGAIAWEAMQNVKGPPGFTNGWSGPGKVHYFEIGRPSTAEQTERAGYLPIVTEKDRMAILKTPSGAIEYIGAIMRADADALTKAGYDINRDPSLLALFYNAWDLEQIPEKIVGKKSYPAPLSYADNLMANWIRDNLPFLEESVGKPDTSPQHVDKCSKSTPMGTGGPFLVSFEGLRSDSELQGTTKGNFVLTGSIIPTGGESKLMAEGEGTIRMKAQRQDCKYEGELNFKIFGEGKFQPPYHTDKIDLGYVSFWNVRSEPSVAWAQLKAGDPKICGGVYTIGLTSTLICLNRGVDIAVGVAEESNGSETCTIRVQ